MFAAVVIVALVTTAIGQNCNPYGQLDPARCNTHGAGEAYSALHTELNDARHQEHLFDFVLNVTLGMHMFLHPCETVAEAALRLFYENVPVPDPHSPWWGQMATVLGGHGPALVGRRRRADPPHLNDENDLLRSILTRILNESPHGQNCIQALINEFKDVAATAFHTKYASFEPPHPGQTTHAPVQTTPAPVHTTIATHPTTTHPTTTPTTTHPTTTHPTTTHPPTTTTTHRTTTPVPVAARCTTCTGLTCLLTPTVGTCSTNVEEFCLTTVQDVQAGREITRSCATRAQCNSFVNNAECRDIETRVLSSGVTCHYCCFGNNCNHPPQLLPDVGTIYHRP